MRTYFNTLVFLLLLSQIVLSIGKEASKKELRLLCGLVLLTAMLSPLGMKVDFREIIREQARDFFETPSEKIPEEDDCRILALSVMQYAAERYGVDEKHLECVVVTDEEGRVTELQIFVSSAPYAVRAQMQEELEEMFGVEVAVYGE